MFVDRWKGFSRKGKELKHITTEIHQITKGKIKRRNKQRGTTKQLENKD